MAIASNGVGMYICHIGIHQMPFNLPVKLLLFRECDTMVTTTRYCLGERESKILKRKDSMYLIREFGGNGVGVP